MCLSNPRILRFCSTECKDSGDCLWCPSSATVSAQDLQVVRARDAGAASPSPGAEQSPVRVTPSPAFLTFLEYKKNLSFSIVGHVEGPSRGNTEEGQKREAAFACFLSHIDSLKRMCLQMEFSVAQANFMSCLHDKAKMHHLSCNNPNHQFPAREQSPIDVGTRKQ